MEIGDFNDSAGESVFARLLGRQAAMTQHVHFHENLIFSVGTQIVTLVDIPAAGGLIRHPRGTVGVVIKSPSDQEHCYRVRFGDGLETPLKQSEITMLA